ncbi:alanine/glycine:cation symporter family protein [Nitratireductor sp. XY-223]|uniref:alanine/glycine:cation symporter family protein n=1 Tax=Nitratireductor sp. XY-223 TaxID=2561926 RepID=UPI00197FCDF3|nr:alanine/glycine:cation symporter family protein [Nitratireductor sp. XY-223]
MKQLFDLLEAATWGFATIPMLVIFGIVFTLFTRFSQVRFFRRMFAGLKKGTEAETGISNRKALLLSVGGRVGAGNIAGVSVAITLGGPGAVFWMWALAIVGMATMLVECSLAQLYKQKMSDGTFRGGPLQTIIFGLGSEFRWLAAIFALCMIAAYGVAVLAFQSNSAAAAIEEGLSLSPWIGGLILAGIVGAIILGGIRRIAVASEVMVPVMAIAYIVMALLVIVANISAVPAVFLLILENAFGLREAVGGGVGAAILHGMQRGLLSNEAGLGSASNVAGAAFAKHPVDQGITQAFGVFIDTIVICSCTAFIILLSDVYVPGATEVDGIALAQRSLATELGGWTSPVLSFVITLILLTTITYAYYMAENGLAFLTGNRIALHALRIVAIVAVFMGALTPTVHNVLFFLDPLLGLMAVINLVVISMLFPKALVLIKDYKAQLSAGKQQPVFDAASFADANVDTPAWNAVDRG